MSALNRRELQPHLLQLKDNAHWRHYVSTLEMAYNRAVEGLLNSDHPDEVLRGECRSYLNLLKTIHNNSPQDNTP